MVTDLVTLIIKPRPVKDTALFPGEESPTLQILPSIKCCRYAMKVNGHYFHKYPRCTGQAEGQVCEPIMLQSHLPKGRHVNR